LVEKRNFAELAAEFARDYFGKRHEAGLRVGRHGEAALERSSTVSSVDPKTCISSNSQQKIIANTYKAKHVMLKLMSHVSTSGRLRHW
jgi:hypothetical protein